MDILTIILLIIGGIFFVAMFRIRAASKRQSRTKEAFENIAGFSPDYQFASFYSKTGIAIDKEQKKSCL